MYYVLIKGVCIRYMLTDSWPGNKARPPHCPLEDNKNNQIKPKLCAFMATVLYISAI